MASTAADLKAEMDKLGVEYPSKAKKADLEKLLAAQGSAPTDTSSEEAAQDPEVGAEGPADLDPPVAADPEYDGPVLLKGLVHHGIHLPAGSPVPYDLSEAEVIRLQKLGVLEGGPPARTSASFEVFQGKDSQHYWHLVAANGEIIAQGEGYSSRKAAEQGIDAVIKAVAEASAA